MHQPIEMNQFLRHLPVNDSRGKKDRYNAKSKYELSYVSTIIFFNNMNPRLVLKLSEGAVCSVSRISVALDC